MASISNNTESWNGHTMLELEEHIKSRFNSGENSSNKVTSLSSSSTDGQYPSAKAVYDAIEKGNIIKGYLIEGKFCANLGSSESDSESDSDIELIDMEEGKIYLDMVNYDLYQYDFGELHKIGGANTLVTELSSSNTDTQYPSAKAVYDAMVDNEETISAAINTLNTNKVDKVTGKGLSTNDYTDAEKTLVEGAAPQSTTYTKTEVDTALALKEAVANKVTSVSSSSTDTQYPSAKCVYDLFNSILSMNITSNGTTLTLQGWIDRISAITVDN